MNTDGGGWTVFQRRMDGSVNFYRNWTDYEQGFGNFCGEYWLGLRKIHRLTPNNISQELRVDLVDIENNTYYAYYGNFSVAGASDKYRLHVSGYNGTARGDSLAFYHSGYQFSTHDQDNDVWSRNCALIWKGGWWYHNCWHSNLNGRYTDLTRWHFIYNSLKMTAMMLRRK